MRGHVDVVNALIGKGADLNVKGTLGLAPLHFASFNEYPEVVKLLLEGGADVDIKNSDGETALDIAERRNYSSIVDLITSSVEQTNATSNQPEDESESNTQHSAPSQDSHIEVGKWLCKFLDEADAARYLECLIEDGFDRMDILKECLEEGDLHFMKKGHKRMTLKRLAEAERRVVV